MMELPIKDLPVRFTKNFEFLDSKNQIVLPCIIWKGDLSHREKQQKIGAYIARLINEDAKAHGADVVLDAVPVPAIKKTEGLTKKVSKTNIL